MNCAWVKDNIILYVYDELADDRRYEFERHVERCAACAGELKQARGLQAVMSEAERPEPSPNLLAASRMRLQEALETSGQLHGWRLWLFDPFAWLRQMRFAPALAMAIFMVGFAGGVLATYRVAVNGNTASIEEPGSQPEEAAIAAIRGISLDPNSNQVEIKFDRLSTDSAQGSLDDPKIQQLLTYAARSNMNSGVRLDSVDLLTQKSDRDAVRQTLIYALRYDSNPGVRLKALDGLKEHVVADMRVRDAILDALLNDENPGVRTEAIHLLEPVVADATVRRALRQLAEYDDSAYIRSESQRLLLSVPEMN